jgi:dihydrofolate reductase
VWFSGLRFVVGDTYQHMAPDLSEDVMGRLIVSAQMTMDSVMDQNEGWFDADGESEQQGVEELRAAEALILGRETYEFLSSFWPKQDGVYADLVNPIPKFVASRTLEGPLTWNAQLLGHDLAEEVAALKSVHSGNLLSYGCGELANILARHGLVDEVRFWLHPVVWGDGVRPFHAGTLPLKLRLIAATTFTSGVVRLSYQPVVG